MSLLGYTKAPKELADAAVKEVTDYGAIELKEFLKVFVIFCDLEEDKLTQVCVERHGDAEIGIAEIRELIRTQGEDCFPWVIAESIGGFDETVDAEGFVHTLRDIRLHNGFTTQERTEFQSVFEKFDQDGSGNVNAVELKNVLRYMGYHPSEEALQKLIKLADSDGSGEIDADEFLVVMREFVTLSKAQMKAVFESFDTDGSGQMDTSEVFECVATMGFMAQKDAVLEAIDEVDKDGTGEIDFDEFFALLTHLRKTEGFSKADREEFDRIFKSFDVDGSGEISTLELSAVLRWLGYPTSLEVLQKLIAEVDVDGSGEIDFDEMCKLIRKYRDREMKQTEHFFKQHSYSVEDASLFTPQGGRRASMSLWNRTELRLKHEFIPSAIRALGWDPNEDMLEKANVLLTEGELDFGAFVRFIKAYRDLELEEYNRRAGFSEEEVANYQETFNKYDKSGDGDLTLKELLPLLTELGKEPKTVIQREKLTNLLKEVDGDGSGEIGFLEFLQLMRKFLNESEAEQLRKEKDVIKRTNFAPDEVSLWRDIFLKFDSDGSGGFDITEGKGLLQAVGVNLNERAMHDRYLSLFRDVDEDEDGDMDFPEFLLLMRKMIDLDFGGIQSRMAPKEPKEETAADKKKAARAERRAEKQ